MRHVLSILGILQSLALLTALLCTGTLLATAVWCIQIDVALDRAIHCVALERGELHHVRVPWPPAANARSSERVVIPPLAVTIEPIVARTNGASPIGSSAPSQTDFASLLSLPSRLPLWVIGAATWAVVIGVFVARLWIASRRCPRCYRRISPGEVACDACHPLRFNRAARRARILKAATLAFAVYATVYALNGCYFMNAMISTSSGVTRVDCYHGWLTILPDFNPRVSGNAPFSATFDRCTGNGRPLPWYLDFRWPAIRTINGRNIIYGDLWLPFAAVAAPLAVLWRLRWRKRRALCRTCDYDLTGNVTGICPECGAQTARTASPAIAANPNPTPPP